MTYDTYPWESLARYLAGESSAEEQAMIRTWLAGEPTRAELLDALDRALHRAAFTPPAGLDVEAALRAVTARRDILPIEPRRAFWRGRPAFVAAAAVLVLLLGGTLWRSGQRAGTGPARITAIGQRDSVVLSDGTRVLLGPRSRLALARGYGRQHREVELTGVALFEVRHDPDRPFRVRAGSAWISDLGTTFAVRSDSGQPVQVIVTAGRVRLGTAGAPANRGVTVAAGDRGVLHPDGRVATERDTTVDAELAWTQGRLVFDNAPIELVRAELRRWYGIELEVADSSLERRHLTASFGGGEPAQQVLTVIALALGASLERRAGDTVVVHMTMEPAQHR
jgi:transmembrane sensor